MELYYTLLFIILFFSFPIKAGNKIISKLFIFLSFLILFIFSIFRVDIGTDYSGHSDAFWGITSDLLAYRLIYLKEFLFYGICRMCGLLNFDYKVVVGIISFLTIYPIYKLTDRTNYFYIIVLFVCSCYLTSFCLMRQFAAVSIATYGLYLVTHNKKRVGVIWLIISCGFHNSFVIFVILLYLALRFGNNKFLTTPNISLLLVILTLCFSIIFSQYGINYLTNANGYLHYLQPGNPNAAKVQLGSGLGVLVRFISYFLLFYINNYSIYSNKEKRGIFNFLFYFLIFFDILSIKIMIFMRMRYIFYPILFYFPVFGNIKFTRRYTQYLSFICLIFICLSYFVFYKSTAELWGNIPYKTWL